MFQVKKFLFVLQFNWKKCFLGYIGFWLQYLMEILSVWYLVLKIHPCVTETLSVSIKRRRVLQPPLKTFMHNHEVTSPSVSSHSSTPPPPLCAAPVDEIHIQQLGSQVSCRAEGIYPKPQLTWSTWPPSSLSLDQEPSVQVTPEQLYTISSSLTLDLTSSTTQEVSYSCNVGTASSSRTATLFLKGEFLDQERGAAGGCGFNSPLAKD